MESPLGLSITATEEQFTCRPGHNPAPMTFGASARKEGGGETYTVTIITSSDALPDKRTTASRNLSSCIKRNSASHSGGGFRSQDPTASLRHFGISPRPLCEGRIQAFARHRQVGEGGHIWLAAPSRHDAMAGESYHRNSCRFVQDYHVNRREVY